MKISGLISKIICLGILSLTIFCCSEKEPTPSNTPISINSLTELQTNIPEGYYHDLHFINDSLAFVAGNNDLIAKSRDGGKSWKKLILPTTRGLSYQNVDFFNELNGIAVGSNDTEGIVLSTKDGGDTWNIVQEGNIRPSIISLPDSNTGYILNGSNTLIKTDDAGVSWTNINLPESALAATVKFKSADEGILGCARGEYYVTKNGGYSWTMIQTPVSDTFTNIFFFDEKTILQGQNKIFRIDKNGKFDVATPPSMFKMYFININQVIGVGQSYSGQGFFSMGAIYTTNDFWNASQKKTFGGTVAFTFTTLDKKNDHEIMIIGTGIKRSAVFSIKF